MRLTELIFVLRELGSAVGALLGLPFYYISLLFIIMQYMRIMHLQRQLFAVKLQHWLPSLGRAIVGGLAAGLLVSLLGAFAGMSLTQDSVLWLWSVAVILILVRVRYLCFAYSAGVLAVLSWLLQLLPYEQWANAAPSWLGSILHSLAGIDAAGLLVLVGLLHLAEAMLVRWQGERMSTPMFLPSKRGKIVGGYMLQGFWPVPILLVVPMAGGAGGAWSGAGSSISWPVLSGADLSQGWVILALPVIIGFTEMTRSLLPAHKARHAARSLLGYSVVILLLGAAAWHLGWLVPIAGVAALVLHELIVWRSQISEEKRASIYVNDERGLMVLGVIPQTPAAAMELQAGEIIQRVNGQRVASKEQLYAALAANPAFCKLDVLNLDGELRFASRSRYAGEHHQLGVILAPDEQANFYAESGPASLWQLVRGLRFANHRRSGASADK